MRFITQPASSSHAQGDDGGGIAAELEALLENATESRDSQPSVNGNVRPPARFWHAGTRMLEGNTGLAMIAASQMFGSLMSVAVKMLTTFDPPMPPLELICVRMIITWSVCVAYMTLRKVPYPVLGPPGIRLLLVLRGFCGFCGLFGTYYSLQYLSIADATVLTFLAPMCTAVAGAVLLKEDFNRRQALASLCSLVGVVLIARPEFIFGRHAQDVAPGQTEGAIVTVAPAQRIQAVGVALFGVLGATGAYTTIRAIGKRAHPMHNIVAFSSMCVVASSTALFVRGIAIVKPTSVEYVATMVAVGVCGFLGQMLMTMGLQRETAGRGTLAVYVQIIFATAFEFVFFHRTPPPLSIVGTLVIVSSAIYVALNKRSPQMGDNDLDLSANEASLEEGLLKDGASDSSEQGYDTRKDATDVELAPLRPLEPCKKAGASESVER